MDYIYSGYFVCRFKMKVGSDLSDDIRRAAIFRDEIGWDNFLVNKCLLSCRSLKVSFQ